MFSGAVPATELHDGTGRERIADLTAAGCTTVLAKGLVASAVRFAAPLYGVGRQGLGWQPVENAGVHSEGRQAVVCKQHRFSLAGRA